MRLGGVPVSYATATDAPAFLWRSPPPPIPPDLEQAQALAQAARAVLRTLPDEERRGILQRLIPFGPEPATGRRPSREELDLGSVVRELQQAHGSRELALASLFVGPDRVAHARKRLRLPPERISLNVLAQRLLRREQPLLQRVREAQRLATLYALTWPVDRAFRVTSGFGPRIHPVAGGVSEHRGVDVGMPVGTDVRAPADGRVTAVRHGPINGNWIELDHGTGVRTVYCHLSPVDVKRGQKVKAGEVVARSGDTGRVTGAHLHYQVKLEKAWVDPLTSRASAEPVIESLRPAATSVATSSQALR